MISIADHASKPILVCAFYDRVNLLNLIEVCRSVCIDHEYVFPFREQYSVLHGSPLSLVGFLAQPSNNDARFRVRMLFLPLLDDLPSLVSGSVVYGHYFDCFGQLTRFLLLVNVLDVRFQHVWKSFFLIISRHYKTKVKYFLSRFILPQ